MNTRFYKYGLVAGACMSVGVSMSQAQETDEYIDMEQPLQAEQYIDMGNDAGMATQQDEAAAALLGAIIDGVIANEMEQQAAEQSAPVSNNNSTANTVTTQPTQPAPDSPQKAQARQIQICLNYFGFDAGEPDGVMGNRSMEAIKAFQSQYNFEPTGSLTDLERDILFAAYDNAFGGAYGTDGGDNMPPNARVFVLSDSVSARQPSAQAEAVVEEASSVAGSPALDEVAESPALDATDTSTSGSPPLSDVVSADGTPGLELQPEIMIETAAPDAASSEAEQDFYVDEASGATVYSSDPSQTESMQFFMNTNAPS